MAKTKAYKTICRSCKSAAFGLPSGGMIGLPSVDDAAIQRSDGLQYFGYIYPGFEAIGLVPEGFHRFKAFLDEHKGHDVATIGPTGRPLAPSKKDIVTGYHRAVPGKDFPAATPPKWEEGKFAKSQHTVVCESHMGDPSWELESETLLSCQPTLLSVGNVYLFRERVIAPLTKNLRAPLAFAEENLTGLSRFLLNHFGHHLVAYTSESRSSP